MRRSLGSQDGQVALVALSITAVLTVLSTMLIQRSVLEQRLTRQSEESARALNLAEAGVEELLAGDIASQLGTESESRGTLGDNVDFVAVERTSLEGEEVDMGRSRDVRVDPDTEFNFTWEGSANGWNNANQQGLLVTLVGDNSLKRYLYGNPSNLSDEAIRQNNDVFDGGLGGESAGFEVKLVRFKAVGEGDSVTLNISDQQNLPAQEYVVDVEAREGETTTNLSAEQSIPQLPDVFDYALFSGGGIEKTTNN